jgi:hypothetical protein
MNDRFSPDWRCVEPFLDALIGILEGGEHLLVTAFLSVADRKLIATSAADVKRHLKGIVISPGIPWVFYDSVSGLSQKLPSPMRKAIVRLDGIQGAYPHERLQVAEDGRWQVRWHINESESAGLDWYIPQERDEAPIVPIPIIDYIAGCVLLFRGGLILPGCSKPTDCSGISALGSVSRARPISNLRARDLQRSLMGLQDR